MDAECSADTGEEYVLCTQGILGGHFAYYIRQLPRCAVCADSVFCKCAACCMQDKKMHLEGLGQKYYTPTSMDLAVTVFWRWMTNLAGPVPWPSKGIPAIWGRRTQTGGDAGQI